LAAGGTGTVATGADAMPDTGGEDLLLPGLVLLGAVAMTRHLKRS
jgi:hypothetical protein